MRWSRSASCRLGPIRAALFCVACASACTGGPPGAPALTGRAAAAPASIPSTARTTATGTVPGAALPDWREIPLAPLGTELTALYAGLHEILYFESAQRTEDSPAAGDGVAADCYRSNGTAPRVLNHDSEDYVLCFAHDRLARVEAVLRLEAPEARALTQRLCDGWSSGAVAATRNADSCGARHGPAAFRLRWRALGRSTVTAVTVVVYTAEGNE